MPTSITYAPRIFAPLHNLVDSGHRRSGGGSKWEDGVQFNPQGCLEVHAHSIDCPPTDKSAFQECAGVVEFESFIIEIGVKWPNARRDMNLKAFLKRQMEVSASSVIEKVIWTGEVPNDGVGGIKTLSHKLSGGVDAGTAKNAKAAVGLLEAKLLGGGTDGAREGGTLHMSPVEAVAAESLLIKRDGNLYTKTTGALVIIGNYTPGSIVAHGGEINLWMSDDFDFDSDAEFKKNEYYQRVERIVLVTWNPCKVYEATITP